MEKNFSKAKDHGDGFAFCHTRSVLVCLQREWTKGCSPTPPFPEDLGLEHSSLFFWSTTLCQALICSSSGVGSFSQRFHLISLVGGTSFPSFKMDILLLMQCTDYQLIFLCWESLSGFVLASVVTIATMSRERCCFPDDCHFSLTAFAKRRRVSLHRKGPRESKSSPGSGTGAGV